MMAPLRSKHKANLPATFYPVPDSESTVEPSSEPDDRDEIIWKGIHHVYR